jgi:hypothetical protein
MITPNLGLYLKPFLAGALGSIFGVFLRVATSISFSLNLRLVVFCFAEISGVLDAQMVNGFTTATFDRKFVKIADFE